MRDEDGSGVIRAPILQVNFRISDAAYSRITHWIDFKQKQENKQLVAAIFMLYPLDKRADGRPMPAVGANSADEVFEEQIHIFKDLKYTFPVLEEDHKLFAGKTLDYANKTYVLT